MSKDKEKKEEEIKNQISHFLSSLFHNIQATSKYKTDFQILDFANNTEIIDIVKKIESKGILSIGLSILSNKKAFLESFLDKLLSDKYKESLLMVDIKKLNQDLRNIELPYLSSMIYELSKKASTSKDKSSKKTLSLSPEACSHISELTKEFLLVITSNESIFKLFVENFSIDKIRQDNEKSIGSKILSQLLQPALIDVLCSKEFHKLLKKYLLDKKFILSTLNLIPELKSTLADLLGINETELTQQLDIILPALLPLAKELLKDPNILKIILTNFKDKLSPETQLANQKFKNNLLEIILSTNFLDNIEKNVSNIVALVSISPTLQTKLCNFLGLENMSKEMIDDLKKFTQSLLILLKQPTIILQLKEILTLRDFSVSFEQDLKNNSKLRDAIYKLLQNSDLKELILRTDIEFFKKLINSSTKVQTLIKTALDIDQDTPVDFSVITKLLTQFPNHAGLLLGISQNRRFSGEFEKILAQRKIREEALKIIEKDPAIFAKLDNPEFKEYISTIDAKVLEELKHIDPEFHDKAFQLRSGYTLLITIDNIKELMLLVDPLNQSAESLLYLLKLSPKLQDLIAKELFSDRDRVDDLIKSNSKAIIDLLKFLSNPKIKDIIESNLKKIENNEPLDIQDLEVLLTDPELAKVLNEIDIDSISNLISNSEYLTHIIVSQLRIYDEYRPDYIKDLLKQTKLMLPALQKLVTNKEIVSEVFSIIKKFQTTQTINVVDIITLISKNEVRDFINSLDPNLTKTLLKNSKAVNDLVREVLKCDKQTADTIISFLAKDGLEYVKSILNDTELLKNSRDKFMYLQDINPVDIILHRPSVIIDILKHDSLQKLPLENILPLILNTPVVRDSLCEKFEIDPKVFSELVDRHGASIIEIIKKISASDTTQELLKITESIELNNAILQLLEKENGIEIIKNIKANIDSENPEQKKFIASYPQAVEVIKNLDLTQDIEKQLTIDTVKIFDILTSPSVITELEKIDSKVIIECVLSSQKVTNYLANLLKLDQQTVRDVLPISLATHYKNYLAVLKDESVRNNIRNIISEFREDKSIFEMMQNEKFFDSVISLVTNKELLENLLNVNHEALDIIMGDISETFSKNNIVPSRSSEDKKRSTETEKQKQNNNNQDLTNKSVADIVSKSNLAQRLTKYGFSQNFTKKIVNRLTKTNAFDLKMLVGSIDNLMNKKRRRKLEYIIDIGNVLALSIKIFGRVNTLKLMIVGLKNLVNKFRKKVNLFDIPKEIGEHFTSKKKEKAATPKKKEVVTRSGLGNLTPTKTPTSTEPKNEKTRSRS